MLKQASNTDASVSAEAPLTLPLMFTSEESTSLVAGGSISFSDASSISLDATAQAPVGAGVEPILILEYPSNPYAALRLKLPDSVEKATNPFLRADDPSIRRKLGMTEASDSEVFADIRRLKDSF